MTRIRNLDMRVSSEPGHSEIPGSRCRAPRNDVGPQLTSLRPAIPATISPIHAIRATVAGSPNK